MREPPGPCGAGRLRCVCWAGPLCVPVGGGPPRGLFCWAGPLCLPVGGGPPARSPHASLAARSGRSRSPARPRHRPPAPRPGPASLRRSRGGLLSVGACCPCVACPGPPGPPAPSTPAPAVLCVVAVVSMPCRPHGSFPSVGDYRCERPGPATAHQFRMQFPSGVVLVCVSPQCCVTRVCELHATFA